MTQHFRVNICCDRHLANNYHLSKETLCITQYAVLTQIVNCCDFCNFMQFLVKQNNWQLWSLVVLHTAEHTTLHCRLPSAKIIHCIKNTVKHQTAAGCYIARTKPCMYTTTSFTLYDCGEQITNRRSIHCKWCEDRWIIWRLHLVHISLQFTC